MSELKLHPNAAQSLSQWHEMIRQGDLQALPALLRRSGSNSWRRKTTRKSKSA